MKRIMNRVRAFGFFILTIAHLHTVNAGTATIMYSGKTVSDARITSISPYFNGGSEGWGNIGYFSSNGNTQRTFLQVPLPEIINNLCPGLITKAYINITFTGLEFDSFKISLHEVFDSLNELSISWNHQPVFNDTALEIITLRKDSINQNPIDTIVSFDVTQLLIKNLTSQKKNCINVVFKALIEDWPEQNCCVFSTSDDPMVQQRPVVIIESPDLRDTLISDYCTYVKPNKLSNSKLISRATTINSPQLNIYKFKGCCSHSILLYNADKTMFNFTGRTLESSFSK